MFKITPILCSELPPSSSSVEPDFSLFPSLYSIQTEISLRKTHVPPRNTSQLLAAATNHSSHTHLLKRHPLRTAFSHCLTKTALLDPFTSCLLPAGRKHKKRQPCFSHCCSFQDPGRALPRSYHLRRGAPKHTPPVGLQLCTRTYVDVPHARLCTCAATSLHSGESDARD